jgi:methylated-DNA-[protein]-cysteine S-methyltransferase
MNFFFTTFPTPLGAFSLAVDDTGALAATAFGDEAALRQRLHEADTRLLADPARTQLAQRQVRAYFAGELREFDLPLAARGTDFQQRAWAALRAIPFGETRTYGQQAALLGNPSAARAVGRANATNPLCLIVPCHRVIGGDGSLTGFAFGEEIKRRLLEHERAAIRAARPAAAAEPGRLCFA